MKPLQAQESAPKSYPTEPTFYAGFIIKIAVLYMLSAPASIAAFILSPR
jgi:hypothetical protein